MLPRLPTVRYRQARLGWAAAWLAILLNVFAPVIAYANTFARLADAPPAAAAAGQQHHEHHHHDAASAGDAPLTPHCQYCLDFAACAPLTRTVVPAAHVRAQGDGGARYHASVLSGVQLRLAYPRGPPSFLLA